VREWLRAWARDPASARVPDAAGWSALVAEADAQGVLALLHEWASAAGGPADVLAGCAERHRRLLARGVAQLELAGRVQRLLGAAGLRVLPLKGAAVSERLYASPAHRPMGDVDLLVLDDFRAAWALLAREGFAVLDRADHAWVLRDPASGTLVELHWSVTSAPGFFPLDGPGLWARSRPGGGLVSPLPSAEDGLVHLALHAAFQHGFCLSLVQWLDVRRVLETERVEPAALAGAAARSRAGPCVRAVLRAAAVVAGGPEARALREALPAAPGLEAWLEEALREPGRLLVAGGTSLPAVRWHIAAGRRGAFVLRTLFASTDPVAAPVRRGLDAVRRAGRVVARWGRP
jgi:hypothetical protein